MMNKKNKHKPKIYLKYFKYSSAGIMVSVPIFLGLTIGLFLDNLFYVRPWLTLVFLFLGVIASFYNILKLIREIKHDSK